MTDRDRLIELLQEHAKSEAPHVDGLFDWADDIADYLIANGVTVNEWISVEERLPDIGIRCLCWTGSCFQIAKYKGEDKWFTDYHTIEGKRLFTHWMPLPEPPKGVDNG